MRANNDFFRLLNKRELVSLYSLINKSKDGSSFNLGKIKFFVFSDDVFVMFDNKKVRYSKDKIIHEIKEGIMLNKIKELIKNE